MKLVCALALCFFVVASAGADESKKGEMFNKMKQERLSEIDQQIGNLQTLKSCLSSASEPQAMRKCQEEHQGKMKEMHSKMKQQRKQNIDEQIQRLQEEKTKIDTEKEKH